MTLKHSLSCIDAEAKTAICALCGEIDIRWKGTGWGCRGKERAYNRAYYARDREHWQSVGRENYAKNREKYKTYSLQWKASHPEEHRQHLRDKSRRRRIQIRSSPHEHFADVEIFERDNWICQLCNRPVDPTLSWPDTESKSLDHVIPLSKGGLHTRSNTQLAHLGCNCSKQARTITVKENTNGS